MVFLGGPRQVGKTTFCQSLLKDYSDGHPAYLNWDSSEDKRKIQKQEWPATEKLIILDEIHKFRNWRNLVKGFFDKLKRTHKFLITGSARLDYYSKGGDSLLGRYHYYRLHPLTFNEVLLNKSKNRIAITLEDLLTFGGFPEPLLKRDETHLKRWHRQRRERVIHTDIRDLEHIRDISMMDVLIDALPERVGSPLSKKNLAQDIEVDFKTIERWLTILERVYYCYRISPFGPPKIRAVKKEQKLYLWDWSEIADKGARWENFVGSHLLKYCHYIEDTQGDKMELRFLRDTDGREVDFVVLKNKKPIFAIECKTGEKKVSPHMKYFKDRTPIPQFFQVHLGTKDISVADGIRILPFATLAKVLNLV